jgi:hypothetical protein
MNRSTSKWIGALVAAALLGTGGFILLSGAMEPAHLALGVPTAPKESALASLPGPDGKPAAEPRPLEKLDTRSADSTKAGSIKAADEGVKSVTFDDIKLDLKKGDPYDASLLTPPIKKLDGKSIRIRGYILPGFQQSGIKNFVLVRDNMECCFGPGALLHDCILVEMTPPGSTNFTVRPVSVEGIFSIREVKDPVNGRYLAIYHLDGKEVK